MSVQTQTLLPGKQNKLSKQFDIIINGISRKVELFKNMISFQLKPAESEEQFLEMLKIKQNTQAGSNSYVVHNGIVTIQVVPPKDPKDQIKKVGDIRGCLASMNVPVKGYECIKPF